MNRDCHLCDGQGCEECDGTGTRYRESWDAGGDMTISVTGSGEGLTDEARKALEEVARVAFEWMAGTGEA